MNLIKENLITIILVIIIAIIIVGICIFGWNSIKGEDNVTNIPMAESYNKIDNDSDQIETSNSTEETQENLTTTKNYINMSKFYFDSDLGRIAEIYNQMLDTLGSQSYIQYSEQDIYSDGTYNNYKELDLINEIEKTEGSDSGGNYTIYKYWINTNEITYDYYEARGTWEKSSYDWGNKAYMIYSFIGSQIIMLNTSEYSISYEENVNINDNNYYKLIFEYIGDIELKEETVTIYIESDTMELREVEILSETPISDYIIKSQQYYYFEYSENALSIPEEILNL